MIVIISYPDEDHTNKVIGHLSQAGAEYVLVDLADFPTKRTISLGWSPGRDNEFVVDGPQGRIDFKETRIVWWRRVRGFDVGNQIANPQHRIFAESETSQAVLGMLDSLRCKWVNPKSADEAAHRKPLQWTVANSLGFRIPQTLATSSSADARSFLQSLKGKRAVFKPFLASIEEWRETRIVEQSDIERLDAVKHAPVIFQEYIEGVDLRITVIGDKVFAAEIDARETTYPFDMRMVVGQAKVKAVVLPDKVERALLQVCRKLGLVYGAADVRRTADDQYYFLEVNPAGQWLFVEDLTGMQISQQLANYLMAN